jgi:predicted  nucleic acid-binding Zn-ribbon protein
LELKQKFENNNTNNNTVNNQTEKTLNDKDTEMSSLETEYKEIVKENINLKVKINQLNEEITTLKSENESQKKNLISKETELNNMKEISKAMIEKEKKKLEEEQNIEPSNTTIISSKNHKKLTWYLIFKYNKNNPKNESQKPDENNYSNYLWVTGNVIRREKL